MWKEFIESLIMVFVAELGDKTQIMLISLSAQYSALQILLGIFMGVFLNHGLAVLIGSALSKYINNTLLIKFVSFIFIAFGLITILYEAEEKKEKVFYLGPILTTALTFFLGEIGDKTQLTAMTLGMKADFPFAVLSGSITGMMIIGLMGIMVGNTLTKFVPSYIINFTSGSIFILFGLIKLKG